MAFCAFSPFFVPMRERLKQKPDFFEIVKFCYFPLQYRKSKPAKKNLSLFIGMAYLYLKFTANVKIKIHTSNPDTPLKHSTRSA